jgi:hypothetical protein
MSQGDIILGWGKRRVTKHEVLKLEVKKSHVLFSVIGLFVLA